MKIKLKLRKFSEKLPELKPHPRYTWISDYIYIWDKYSLFEGRIISTIDNEYKLLLNSCEDIENLSFDWLWCYSDKIKVKVKPKL